MRISDWSSDVCSSDLNAITHSGHTYFCRCDKDVAITTVRLSTKNIALIGLSRMSQPLLDMDKASIRLLSANGPSMRPNRRGHLGMRAQRSANARITAPTAPQTPLQLERRSVARRVGKECIITRKTRG